VACVVLLPPDTDQCAGIVEVGATAKASRSSRVVFAPTEDEFAVGVDLQNLVGRV
jgi:hypothetical protein